MGYLIKEAREKAGLTQDELADKAGISRSIINGLETGRATQTLASTLQKIANAMNLTINDIFYNEEI